MADLYRKSALEKISSPEQLDKTLTVTSPLSWLVLVGITLIIAATIVWGFLGTIPMSITVQGIIASPDSTNAIYSGESGTVMSVLVHEGADIHFGDAVLTYKDGRDEIKTVYSDQVGVISGIMTQAGENMIQGNEIIRISPTLEGSQVAVCYVPISDAGKLERGMRAQIYLNSVDSQSYGYMVARIINIDSYAVSNTGMGYVLGTNNNLAASFQQMGALVAVTCEFYPDDTESGYFWSNEKGKALSVSNGSVVTARIITEEVKPITKLFSKLSEIWGD